MDESFAIKVTIYFEWTIGFPLVPSSAESLAMHAPKEEWLNATVTKGTNLGRHFSEGL